MGDVTKASAFHQNIPSIVLCLAGFISILASLATVMVYDRQLQGLLLNLGGLILIGVGLWFARLRSFRTSRRYRLRADEDTTEM